MNMKNMIWSALTIGKSLCSRNVLYDISCEYYESKISNEHIHSCYLCKDNTWKSVSKLQGNPQIPNSIDWYESEEAAKLQLKAYFEKHPVFFARYTAAIMKGECTCML